MTPDPTIRGLLYRADVAADVAAALMAWAAYELDSAYTDTPTRDVRLALRLAGRILRRHLDALRRYRRQVPHSLGDWRPGDPGEAFDDCL